MAADIDAVAVFYEDRTFKYRDWDNIDDLQENKKIVSVGTFHVQNPGQNPNVVMSTGHDIYAFKKIPQGWVMREGDLPGGPSGDTVKERFFKKGASDQTQLDLGKPAASAGGGMRVDLRSMPDNDPNYTTLQADANAKALELRLQAPPQDGLY